jgi:hypothetical protein
MNPGYKSHRLKSKNLPVEKLLLTVVTSWILGLPILYLILLVILQAYEALVRMHLISLNR